MATDLISPELTPEQLAVLANDKDYELVDGLLVERKMGNKSDWVASKIIRLLGNYVDDHDLGWVFASEAGYKLDPKRPKLVRKPDVSFVRNGRLPDEQPADGYDKLAPDLAVEVVSPSDTVQELEEKISEYLAAGVQLVWVINPVLRTVAVHHPNRSITVLREGDELTAEEVITGFRCPVNALFAKLQRGSRGR